MSLLKTGILEELKLEGGLRFLKVGFIYWILENFNKFQEGRNSV